MSEKMEAKGIVIGDIVKVREGIEEYRIKNGKIFQRQPTECEQLLKKWAECVKEGVRISCDIVPRIGPMWNHDERASFIVKVANRTGYFRLEEVVVHLIEPIKTSEGKAKVARERCSPDVIQLPDIKPGGTASTQTPKASWCNGVPQNPARRGFTLLCRNRFPEYDTVKAGAIITYKAIPYLEERCFAKEPIVGT